MKLKAQCRKWRFGNFFREKLSRIDQIELASILMEQQRIGSIEETSNFQSVNFQISAKGGQPSG